jgi:predicted O-linked N-acetylglucosamine transferase (SPINDLY family)
MQLRTPSVAKLLAEGVAHHRAARLAAAETRYRKVLAAHPDSPDVLHLLGVIAQQTGRSELAIELIRQAIEREPNDPIFFSNLGNALRDQNKLNEAEAAFRKAIRLDPNCGAAYCNLGTVMFAQGKYGEAGAALRQAVRIHPNFVEAHSNIGAVLTAQGNIDEAIEAYRRAVVLQPDSAAVSANLLLSLNYDERISPEMLFEEHRHWAERFKPLIRPMTHRNDRSAERRLKVGYVSPDFRTHSVAHFLQPLLQHHDRSAVEVFCYADILTPDAATDRFKQLADHWVVTVGISDETLSERVRSDGIDILVDLAGHTSNSRPLVFARKPAPVQVTWLGYPNTTGLTAMDYRLVDDITDPERQADAFASETLVRLTGGFLCYGTPRDAPRPAAPPCLASDTFTFGSFNNAAKLSGGTLRAWAALLRRLPSSRLLLKSKSFTDQGTRACCLDRLKALGIAADRVDFHGWLAESDHLASYGRVDVALDPFPYNGTTTTCEALWMGVPVVTLLGDRHAGRVGASLLTQVGLADLIAGSVQDYVEIAAALARDPARLVSLRGSLRPRVAASNLCDAPRFARKIEATFRAMWKQWCEASGPGRS